MDRQSYTVACLMLGAMLLAAGGCASHGAGVAVIQDHPPHVALGAFNGGPEDSKRMPPSHQLGAGDSLGQSMYTVYLAHYRAKQEEQRIAGVRTDNHRDD